MGFAYDLYNSVNNGKLEVVQEFSYWNKQATGTGVGVGTVATISAVPGTLDKVVINAPGVLNFTLNDGSTLVGQVASNLATTNAPVSIPYGVQLKNGLVIASVASLAAAADFTVVYR